jgi:acyl carrier protein
MTEPISSRTPEGEPNRCPVCRKAVCIEPSAPSADAPCPHCGTLLWFLRTPTGVQIYSDENILRIRDEILQAFHEKLGIPAHQYASLTSLRDGLALDSLDLVEFIMELEEESLHTPVMRDLPLGEIIEYLLRRRL